MKKPHDESLGLLSALFANPSTNSLPAQHTSSDPGTTSGIHFGGVPPVINYQMPRHDFAPNNTARWPLDASSAVLLIHDMQGYFLRPFAARASLYSELVENIVMLRKECVRAGIPVAYTAQPGGMTQEQRGLLAHFWGPGMSTNSVDREVIPELTPAGTDRVFTKWRYSAFVGNDLASWMHRLGRTQLIICGVYAHVGILMTACDAYQRDIQPFVVADATADFSRGEHELALKYAAARCAMVYSASALADQI